MALDSGKEKIPKSKIHISQTGTCSALQYVSLEEPAAGAFLYFQNLTALNDYAKATENSLGDTVGGTSPELGFALPPIKEKPVPAGEKIVLSDAFIAFSTEYAKGEKEQAKKFLALLADIYFQLPTPVTQTIIGRIYCKKV